MIKILKALLLLIAVAFAMAGCNTYSSEEMEAKNRQISELEEQVDDLRKEIFNLENDVASYENSGIQETYGLRYDSIDLEVEFDRGWRDGSEFADKTLDDITYENYNELIEKYNGNGVLAVIDMQQLDIQGYPTNSDDVERWAYNAGFISGAEDFINYANGYMDRDEYFNIQ